MNHWPWTPQLLRIFRNLIPMGKAKRCILAKLEGHGSTNGSATPNSIQNLKNVAQNLDLPRQFEVLDIFGGKSKSEAPRPIKICTKRVPIKINNW